MKNAPTKLSNSKSKVGKLVTVPVGLSKLSDVVKNDKIPDITNLATDASVNVKINEAKGEITNITNLATTTALTAVENKIPNVSNLVHKIDYNTKINETENKITTDHDHEKYCKILLTRFPVYTVFPLIRASPQTSPSL